LAKIAGTRDEVRDMDVLMRWTDGPLSSEQTVTEAPAKRPPNGPRVKTSPKQAPMTPEEGAARIKTAIDIAMQEMEKSIRTTRNVRASAEHLGEVLLSVELQAA
jgi:hypothetical protein